MVMGEPSHSFTGPFSPVFGSACGAPHPLSLTYTWLPRPLKLRRFYTHPAATTWATARYSTLPLRKPVFPFLCLAARHVTAADSRQDLKSMRL